MTHIFQVYILLPSSSGAMSALCTVRQNRDISVCCVFFIIVKNIFYGNLLSNICSVSIELFIVNTLGLNIFFTYLFYIPLCGVELQCCGTTPFTPPEVINMRSAGILAS